MPCCMAERYGWCQNEPLVEYKDHEGKEYCIFHAPLSEKGISGEEFNKRIFLKIKEAFPGVCNLSGTVFLKDIDFGYFDKLYINFTDAIFTGQANFSKAKLSGEANFSGAHFLEVAIFSEAQFLGDAYFKGTTFSRKANFSEVTFNKRVFFYESIFSGVVDFFWAKFSEQAAFSRAKFNDEALFSGAKFSKATYFVTTIFSKPSIFQGVKFGSEVRFLEATFAERAFFSNAKFDEDALFSKATFRGTADFFNATFKGMADFSGAILENAVFSRSTFFEKAEFLNETFWGAGELNSLNIKEKIRFEDVNLSKVAFLNTDLRKVDFVNCKWPQKQGRNILYDEIKLYEGINGGYFSLKKLFYYNEEKFKKIEILYRRLKQKYKEDHDEQEASNWHYCEKEMFRKGNLRRRFFGLTALYWLSSGYGERVFRSALCLGLLVFGFLPLLLACGGLIPTGEGQPDLMCVNGVRDTFDFVNYQAIVLNILQFATFQKVTYFKPASHIGEWFKVLTQILIPLQTALFAFAVRNRFRR